MYTVSAKYETIAPTSPFKRGVTILLLSGVLLTAQACTRVSDSLESDPSPLVVSETDDFRGVCTQVAEAMIEDTDAFFTEPLTAREKRSEIKGVEDGIVRAFSVMRVGAVGYYDGTMYVTCRFAVDEGDLASGYELLDVKVNSTALPFDMVEPMRLLIRQAYAT